MRKQRFFLGLFFSLVCLLFFTVDSQAVDVGDSELLKEYQDYSLELMPSFAIILIEDRKESSFLSPISKDVALVRGVRSKIVPRNKGPDNLTLM